MITFGEPRLGNKQFAEHLHSIEGYRVVHFHDIVPHVPAIDQGYHH